MIKKVKTFLFVFVPVIAIAFIIFFAITSSKKTEEEFIKNGFIIYDNQVASFNKGTLYKTNLDNEISFVDGDNKYNISKESFIHYEDNSIQFLSKGSLLDIENINVDNTVPYYNVNMKDIITYEDKSYILNSNKFRNVLGKISDNKYIIVGEDVYLAYLDSNLNVSSKVESDFYEITFQDGNIVNLSSLNFNYQTVSNSIYIFVGENIILDLGSKQICKYSNNIKECVFDITQDLSDGNNSSNGGTDKNVGQTDKNINKTEINTEIDVENNQNLSTPKIILESSSITFNSINTLFKIIDDKDVLNDKLNISLKNMITNSEVYKTSISKNQLKELLIDSLTPNSNYLLTIKGQNKETKEDVYLFQKNFSTDLFGFNVKKELVSTESITYKIDYDQSLGFESFTFELVDRLVEGYELCNENTCKKYIGTNVINTEDLAIYNLLKISGLDSNKRYTLSFDNFKTQTNISYSNTYKTSITLTTLKKMPELLNNVILSFSDNYLYWENKNVFKDEDNSIKSYTYEIYDKKGNFVESINKKTLGKILLSNFIKNEFYNCKITLNINDNEKDISLHVGTLPFRTSTENLVSFTPKEESYYFVEGKIEIENENENENKDESYFYKVSSNGEKIEFEPGDIIEIENLKPGQVYTISVYEGDVYIGSFKATTLIVPDMTISWGENPYYKPLSIEVYNPGEEVIYEYVKKISIKLQKEDKKYVNEVTLDGSVEEKKYKFADVSLVNIFGFEENSTNDNLLPYLDMDDYTISIVATDINGETLPLINSIQRISRMTSDNFVVKLLKNEQNKFNGYYVAYGEKQESIEKIIKNETEMITNEFSNKKFTFDESFSKGDCYQFVARNGEISSKYYPEKESPVIKLTPLTSTETTVTYEIDINDPDETLNTTDTGVFYQFEDGVEQKADIKCAQQDEKCTIEITKDDSVSSNKYRIYYKAEVSNLYVTNKTETIIEDYLDFVLDEELTLEVEAISAYEGINILLKNTSFIERIGGYQIQIGDDYKSEMITDVDNCFVPEGYYGCINIKNLTNISNGTTINVITYYDDGSFGYGLNKDYFVYQNKKLEYVNKEDKDKVYEMALGNLVSKEDLEFRTDVKPKGVNTKTFIATYNEKDSIPPAANIEINKKFKGLEFNVKNSNVDKFNIYIYEEAAKCTLNNNKATCSSSFKEKIECEKNKTCEISNLEYATNYYIISALDTKNNNVLTDVLATYDSSIDEPIYNMQMIKTLSISNILESIDANYESIEEDGKVKRTLKIDIKLSNSDLIGDINNFVYKLRSKNEYDGGRYCSTNSTENEDLCKYPKASSTITTNENTITIEQPLIRDEFAYGTKYDLKLDFGNGIEEDLEIDVEKLEYPTFAVVSTPYFGETDELTDNYLEVQLVKSDKDKTLIDNEYQIILSECDDDNDDKCSNVVEITKTTKDFAITKFNNIKDNTRYKITINSSFYSENESFSENKYIIEGEKKLKKEYYIYTNNNDIIDIGDSEINVEDTYNGSAQKTLVISYNNSKNLTKVNKIVYTFIKDNNIYSYTQENPTFYKTETCSSEDCITYQNVLDLTEFDLETGKYLIEMSYRYNDDEVDRLSATIDYKSVIYIKKIEDLLELSNKVNNGDTRKGYTYVLVNDLDFKSPDSYYNAETTSSIDYNNNGLHEFIIEELKNAEGFNPIGYYKTQETEPKKYDELRVFSGDFDGNNHTISNLYINKNNFYSVGLFGAVEGSTIKNLNIKNAKVTGISKLSILAGYAKESNFENISITGELTMNLINKINITYYSGMLLGYGENVKIKNCKVSGNINSNGHATGGIAGNIVTNSLIEQSLSTVDISCGKSSCGGILGEGHSVNIIKTNYNGKISAKANKPYGIGGIAGNIVGLYPYNRITEVSVEGELDCSDTNKCGGVIGESKNTRITKIFSNMNIFVGHEDEPEFETYYAIGGLIGKADSITLLLSSYSIGTINVFGYKNTDDYLNGLGSLVGIFGDYDKEYNVINVKNCYSLSDINGYIENTIGIGMIGINNVKLQTLYNGGTISEVGNGSINGYVYGGIKIPKSLVDRDDFENIKNEVKRKTEEERLNYFNIYAESQKTLEDLKLYSIDQQYNIKNKFAIRIGSNNDELNIFADGFKTFFKDDNGLIDANYTYDEGYYPIIRYKGYGDKIVTLPKIKIG